MELNEAAALGSRQTAHLHQERINCWGTLLTDFFKPGRCKGHVDRRSLKTPDEVSGAWPKSDHAHLNLVSGGNAFGRLLSVHGDLVCHHLPKGGIAERGHAANCMTVIDHFLDQGQSFDLNAAVDPLCTQPDRTA